MAKRISAQIFIQMAKNLREDFRNKESLVHEMYVESWLMEYILVLLRAYNKIVI